MNYPMVKRLVLKDWSFNRIAIAAYIFGALVSLLVMRFGNGLAFLFGGIALIFILLGMGAHFAIITVLHERTENTLPFVMSLPISVAEYTTAKILTNLLLFLLPWITVLLGTLVLIVDSPNLANGLIPYTTINMGMILVGYVLLIGVALVSESMGWTVASIVTCNLLFQSTLHLVPRMTAIKVHLEEQVAVWNTTALIMVGSEAAAIVLILSITFYCQSRKKDFT